MKGYIGLFAAAGLATAWWDGPHVLSAEIAARHLKALNRNDVLDMVNKVFYAGADIWPCHADLQSSATWLDYVKNRARTTDANPPVREELGYLFLDHLRMWDRFHYYDALYVDPEGVKTLGWTSDWAIEARDNLDAHFLQNQTLNTLLTALGSAETALWGSDYKDADKTPWSLGVNLHHVTHLIGDLHMPCHTTALWNYVDHLEHKRGMHDEGANYINVRFADGVCPSCVEAKISNLHAFWDAMGGYETRNRFDIWGKTDAKVTEIMTLFPNTTLIAAPYSYNLENASILDMMKESFTLSAIGYDRYDNYFVYKGVEFLKHFCAIERRTQSSCTAPNGKCPAVDCFSDACRKGCSGDNRFEITQDYVDFAVKASQERIAATGYRIAHRMIKAYDKMGTELKSRVEDAYKFAKSRQHSLNPMSGCVSLSQPTSGAEMNVLLSIPIMLGAAFAVLF